MQIKKQKQAISLLLVILLLGAILIGAFLMADVLIRQSQLTTGFDFSEKAFTAAEAGKENVAYNVLQNYCQVDVPSDCNVSSTLDDGSQYSSSLTIDKKEPNTGQTTGIGEEITNSNPWEAVLNSSSSLLLSLDLNSQDKIYPDDLTISQNPTSSGELIFWQCETLSGPPRVCDESNQTSTVYTTFPQILDLSGSQSYYYKIRINNTSAGSTTYTLTPTSTPPVTTLPIDVIIENTGDFKDYQRKTIYSLPKWQILNP